MPPFADLSLPRRERFLASAASLLLHGQALAALIWGAGGASAPRTSLPMTSTRITMDVIAVMPSASRDAPSTASRDVATAPPSPAPSAAVKPPPRPPSKPAASTATAPRTPPAPSSSPIAETPPQSATGGESPPAPASDATQSRAEPTATPPLQSRHDARFDADYLNNPRPVYPPLARRNGETGTVHLNVQVSETGHALAVSVKTSSGFPRLDKSALDTVLTWRFVPARQGDTPIPSWVVVPIAFALQ